MLSAKKNLSNIFLHPGQNIDIARQNSSRVKQTYGTNGPLALSFG
jgi:hypothetical protein